MVALLCDNKASLDLQDNAGATALLLAARRNNVSVARLLLERGCNPLLIDRSGSSPLHAAGRNKCWSLLAIGAFMAD